MEDKTKAPYGPRPQYPTPRLNCLVKRPADSPVVCAACGESLAGKLQQSTVFTCDHCGRKFHMCRDCGCNVYCPDCGGWLLNSWEAAGKWLLRLQANPKEERKHKREHL
jgi:predicted RNA-binding Zn-ribbon protein involved in translation (DUF1610 family)